MKGINISVLYNFLSDIFLSTYADMMVNEIVMFENNTFFSFERLNIVEHCLMV